MKKAVAGVLLSFILCIGYEAFAAFPSFVASAVWSSDLRPDPDYVDETDVYFFAVPDAIASDFPSPDSFFEEVPENKALDGEPQNREASDDMEGEKPQEEIAPPTDTDENETEDFEIATPDKAVIDTPDEPEDEPKAEGEIEQ